jgi:septal ring factor EnvC (AmiA/AmiB activator)
MPPVELSAFIVVAFVAVAAVGVVVGWLAASGGGRAQVERAEAATRASLQSQHARAVQRLRDARTDLENHVKDLADRLARRERLLRALQDELRDSRAELARLREGVAVPIEGGPQLSTPLTPSKFQDLFVETQSDTTPAAQQRKLAG